MERNSKEFSIVSKLSRFFELLRKNATFPFYLKKIGINRKLDDKSTIEKYVLSFLILSIFLLFSSPFWVSICSLLIVPIIFLAVFRIFEIIIVQINLLFFDWYRAFKDFNLKSSNEKQEPPYEIQGALRLLIMLLINYIEIIFWFSLVHLNLSSILNESLVSINLIEALNLSFFEMTNFGFSIFAETLSPCGILIAMIQGGIGLFMALFILARFISLIPSPVTEDEVEDKMKKFEEEEFKRKVKEAINELKDEEKI